MPNSLKAYVCVFIGSLLTLTHISAKAQPNSRKPLVTIKLVEGNVNTSEAEYAPIPFDNGNAFLYTYSATTKGQRKSRKETSKIAFLNNRHEVIKTADYLLPSLPEATFVSISGDGKTAMVYNAGLLYTTKRKADNSWEKPLLLPETINIGVYQPNGTLNYNATEMYFVSDAEGGIGGYDIYHSKLDSTGNWQLAENLGDKVNSNLNENAAFLDQDGETLYFSSLGHGSMGGLDVYRSVKVNGQWEAAENLGQPINSDLDDVFFGYVAQRSTGFMASNRKNGKGEMDIYEFHDFRYSDTATAKPFKNSKLSVLFDGASNVDPVQPSQDMIWHFGDGQSATGKAPRHEYTTPGVYHVIANGKDLITGAIDSNAVETDVDITNVNFVGFRMPDAKKLKVGMPIEFDASLCQAKNTELVATYWHIGVGPEKVSSGKKLFSFTPTVAGKLPVTLEAIFINKNTNSPERYLNTVYLEITN